MSELNIALAGITAVILFLFGLESFSKEIQRISGERFRMFLSKATKFPLVGVLIGAIVTSVIQSSSATSVITMGLVNAGVISFKNSIGIIFGANIGTTVTAQLVAFKLTNFAPLIIILGFLLSIIKNRFSFFGKTIFYFGFVFFTLNLISQAVAPLQYDTRLIEILTSKQNIIYSVFAGALFTALVQSSSVTTGLAVIFTQTGLLNLDNAIPLIMGANIGTTFTALMAIINLDIAAKRTAFSHMIFNVGGVLIFLPFIGILSRAFSHMQPAVALANIHLLFNVVTTAVFISLVGPLYKLILKILPNSSYEKLEMIEFPSLKDIIDFDTIEDFIKTGFGKLFEQLKDNYNFTTLSIESNYKHIFDKVQRRVLYFDQLQKDYSRFFSDVINHTDDKKDSQKIVLYINQFEYLYQVHDSLKDIIRIKETMDEMYIEMHTDMILHYREISTRTLNIFELIYKRMNSENVDDRIIVDEFVELQQTLNNFSRELFKLMTNTERNDIGNNMHFMTYSQRLKDKMQNLFDLLRRQTPT